MCDTHKTDYMIIFLCTGIYHQTLTHKKLGIDKQMLACRVIPFLIPLTLEPALNLKQVWHLLQPYTNCVNLLTVPYFKAYWEGVVTVETNRVHCSLD